MRFSTILALALATASAAPALAWSVESDASELLSRAYKGTDGKVHWSPGVRQGKQGCGSAKPRSVKEELYARTYIGPGGKVHYAPGVQGSRRPGSHHGPKGAGRPRELYERDLFYGSLYLD
ncbi:uncharacterized protein C8Q71DRAFT_147794 [Rhodofomes roseus]|uniref:Uncharacterized protein n=1 Tax=Rhodofomes roseus TaxID=34475 RepID=A0ABQ8KB04_9APHY|nr:uncharacterized protein C8Q71DRAFT_147794 [Rhodofomes roseus]KAH9834568.1 hypothetical protein C8Q71DRAFT_147794 [Rhodofomes roseus]